MNRACNHFLRHDARELLELRVVFGSSPCYTLCLIAQPVIPCSTLFRIGLPNHTGLPVALSLWTASETRNGTMLGALWETQGPNFETWGLPNESCTSQNALYFSELILNCVFHHWRHVQKMGPGHTLEFSGSVNGLPGTVQIRVPISGRQVYCLCLWCCLCLWRVTNAC